MNNNKTKKNRFKKDMYSSKDGMLTCIWGPALWHYLHTMSFNYPNNPSDNDKKNYKSFILNLKNVIPCRGCRVNLHRNFKTLPLRNKNLKNRYMFSKYIYDLHEHINTMLNKKSGLTYDIVRDRYENFRAKCNTKIIKTKKKEENGCIKPFNGIKSKCILKIVPETRICDTLQIDKKCTNDQIY